MNKNRPYRRHRADRCWPLAANYQSTATKPAEVASRGNRSCGRCCDRERPKLLAPPSDRCDRSCWHCCNRRDRRLLALPQTACVMTLLPPTTEAAAATAATAATEAAGAAATAASRKLLADAAAADHRSRWRCRLTAATEAAGDATRLLALTDGSWLDAAASGHAEDRFRRRQNRRYDRCFGSGRRTPKLTLKTALGMLIFRCRRNPTKVAAGETIAACQSFALVRCKSPAKGRNRKTAAGQPAAVQKFMTTLGGQSGKVLIQR